MQQCRSVPYLMITSSSSGVVSSLTDTTNASFTKSSFGPGTTSLSFWGPVSRPAAGTTRKTHQSCGWLHANTDAAIMVQEASTSAGCSGGTGEDRELAWGKTHVEA